jgi:hypothetical protein
MESPYLIGLIAELKEFDAKHKAPLPKPLQNWRNRWVKSIKKLMPSFL